MPRTRTNILKKVETHLNCLYPEENCQQLAETLLDAIGPVLATDGQKAPQEVWGPEDILLITYGDSIRRTRQKPLLTLEHFLNRYIGNTINCVHILPFYPYTSDDGFAVVDYSQVNPELGKWSHIDSISKRYKLMADLVINHVSSNSQWFKNFQYQVDPGKDYFISVPPETDLSMVVRPRQSPLLRHTETRDGVKHVWCTFSHDQVDLNFQNPQVLIDVVRTIGLYMDHGAQLIRLDAVAFLWKELGTPCIHLKQTHEAIKLMRTLSYYKDDELLLVSETNVPNHENITYFGNGDEAQIIYNFSLPPLMVHALLTGQSQYLRDWMISMVPPPAGCTYLNFIASHDGIGLRPAEGVLPAEEIEAVIHTIEQFGGLISYRTDSEGQKKPYEMNVSLYSALQGTVDGRDEHNLQRFLCAHTVMLGMEGLPAFYIHSLLGTQNDIEKLEATGHNRSINRHRWDYNDLIDKLDNAETHHHQLFLELLRRINIRKKQKAFHPNSLQFVLQLNDAFIGFWRQSHDRCVNIYVVANLTKQPQSLSLNELNLDDTQCWWDLLTDHKIMDVFSDMVLSPYQCIWLTNRKHSELDES